ncbi:LUD domain-containing protein [Anaerosinus sp.]
MVSPVDEAIHRARQIAAPIDALRLQKDTPSTKLGKCIDCQHKNKICNDFVLITVQFTAGRIKVIIVQGLTVIKVFITLTI